MDTPLGGRLDRWFAAYNTPGNVYLPLVMVDSGHDFSNGDEYFSVVYDRMITRSMARPSAARMTVTSDRIGDLLRLGVTLTNASGETLSAANDATLTALVFEEPISTTTLPYVAAAGTTAITSLDNGDTGSYTLEVATTGLDANRTRWVVIADYVPAGSNSAYDTLQAVTGP